ncbi:MAG: hypothetical protein AAF357_09355, partial [Verrucomicrobiota bacterium]
MGEDPTFSGAIDVVYLVGTGAADTDDWELRISLRSWLQHFPELRTLWIVGHRPGWLDLDHPRIRYLAAGDPYQKNKDANLIQKMIRVAMEPDVTEDFIFCSDDQGLLKDCVFSDFRPYHSGPIRKMKLGDGGHRKWQERMLALADFLEKRGHGTTNFDGHIPYPMKKTLAMEFLETDFGVGGYPIMSLYFNLTGATGIPLDSDRIRAGMYSNSEKPSTVDDKLGKNRFYSIGGGSPDCWYLVRRLEERFPAPAPWEIGT